MDRIRDIGSRVANIAQHFSALLLASMFVVFVLQIVFRYLLNWPVGWTVEWVTIAWLWVILFSFAFVITADEMIRLDIVYSSVPRQLRNAFDVFTGLSCAAIFAWTLPDVWDYVDFMKIERTAYMLLSFKWVFIVYIPFHVAVIVRMALLAWGGLTGANHPPVGVEHPASAATSAESHDYD